MANVAAGEPAETDTLKENTDPTTGVGRAAGAASTADVSAAATVSV